MNLRDLALDGFFDGQALPTKWIVEEAVTFEALSHSRSSRDDDQVAVLEPTRHPVQVVESRRDADDPLPALHLQRDPLHGWAEQVIEPGQLALVAVVRDAEHE